MNKEKLEVVVRDVIEELLARKVPIGISVRLRPAFPESNDTEKKGITSNRRICRRGDRYRNWA